MDYLFLLVTGLCVVGYLGELLRDNYDHRGRSSVIYSVQSEYFSK
jgi:hypothetical protein